MCGRSSVLPFLYDMTAVDRETLRVDYRALPADIHLFLVHWFDLLFLDPEIPFLGFHLYVSILLGISHRAWVIPILFRMPRRDRRHRPRIIPDPIPSLGMATPRRAIAARRRSLFAFF